MTTITSQKDWRKEKRLARKSLSQNDKQDYSHKIAQQLIGTNAYKNAQCIGSYLALAEETCVKQIIESAWADGKRVYLPIVTAWGQPLKFAPYKPESKVIKGQLDIDVPDVDESEYIAAYELDLVVTPLVAFDENKNRIGMGGGFYDRTFAFKKQRQEKPTLVGVAFDIQRTSAIISINDWDVCPDAIITESIIYQ